MTERPSLLNLQHLISRNSTLLYANNKSADQHAHVRSPIN